MTRKIAVDLDLCEKVLTIRFLALYSIPDAHPRRAKDKTPRTPQGYSVVLTYIYGFHAFKFNAKGYERRRCRRHRIVQPFFNLHIITTWLLLLCWWIYGLGSFDMAHDLICYEWFWYSKTYFWDALLPYIFSKTIKYQYIYNIQDEQNIPILYCFV